MIYNVGALERFLPLFLTIVNTLAHVSHARAHTRWTRFLFQPCRKEFYVAQNTMKLFLRLTATFLL